MATEIPIYSELFEAGKAAALLHDDTGQLTEESFAAGNVANIVLGISAALAEEAANIALELDLRQRIDTSVESDLDALVLDHFSLERFPANAAVGQVTFSRASAAAGNVSIPAGTIVRTADGVEFTTDLAVTLTGLSVSTNVTASENGLSGNVAAAMVVVLISTLSDTTVGVSNAAVMAGGAAAETDSDFRGRVRGYLATLRRGTKAALEQGALTVGGVAEATTDESTDPVTVYVADASGQSNASLEAEVLAELENWRAAGVLVNVAGAVVVNQAVTVTLTFEAGFDTASVQSQVIEEIVAYAGSLAIGETFRIAKLHAAILNVSGIADANVTVPAGNVAPAGNELLRTPATQVVFA